MHAVTSAQTSGRELIQTPIKMFIKTLAHCQNKLPDQTPGQTPDQVPVQTLASGLDQLRVQTLARGSPSQGPEAMPDARLQKLRISRTHKQMQKAMQYLSSNQLRVLHGPSPPEVMKTHKLKGKFRMILACAVLQHLEVALENWYLGKAEMF